MPECAKVHLQQSRISTIFRGGPPDPSLSGEGIREGGLNERDSEVGLNLAS